MRNKFLGRLLLTLTLMAGAAAPVLALDYEAKPIMWILQSPFRTAGAVSGAVVCGAASGPINDGFSYGKRGTRKMATHLGDENGAGQIAASVPVGGSVGLLVGAPVGVYHGFFHGWKKGWEKPFSRWSYITMEEK